jgi:hypothetical protein
LIRFSLPRGDAVTTLVLFVGWLALGVWALGCVALWRQSCTQGPAEQWAWWEYATIPLWPYFALRWFWDEVNDGAM